MKVKFIFLITIFFFLHVSLNAAAIGPGDPPSKDNPFSFDESLLDPSMDRLTDLEAYVWENPGTSLSELQANKHPIVEGMNLVDTASQSPMGIAGDGPAGLPSFLWGFCLGAIGILIVWLVTEDNDELKKSLMGCLVSSLISGAIYLITYLRVQ